MWFFLGPTAKLTNNVTDPALSPFRLTSRSKSVDKSQEEFPKELMEDWSTMEVCVDCKKFISEIINSSRRSLSLANKRARLKRKTQSFYMSSPGTSEYCPSERTINEIWAVCLLLCFRLHEVIIHERGHRNRLSPRCFVPLDWLGFAFSHRISYSSSSQRHRELCLDLCRVIYDGSAAPLGENQ